MMFLSHVWDLKVKPVRSPSLTTPDNSFKHLPLASSYEGARIENSTVKSLTSRHYKEPVVCNYWVTSRALTIHSFICEYTFIIICHVLKIIQPVLFVRYDFGSWVWFLLTPAGSYVSFNYISSSHFDFSFSSFIVCYLVFMLLVLLCRNTCVAWWGIYSLTDWEVLGV